MIKRKPSANVEHRLTKLEEQYTAIDGKIDEIKTYVSNHLVHKIDATKADLETLLDRKQAHDAVKNFLNNALKLSMSLATITWVILQVVNHFYPMKEAIARLFLA